MPQFVASFTRHPGRGYQEFADVVFEMSTKFAHTDESEYRFFTPFSESAVEELLLTAIDEYDELRLYTLTSARTTNADPIWKYGAQAVPRTRVAANVNLSKRRTAMRRNKLARRLYAATYA